MCIRDRFKARVRPAAFLMGGAFLPGGEDDVITVGLNRRAGGEAPFDRAGGIVRKGVVGQIDRLAGRIDDFNPVGKFAVVVAKRRDVGGDDLVENQHAGFQIRRCAEVRIALLGVFIAGRNHFGNDEAFILSLIHI